MKVLIYGKGPVSRTLATYMSDGDNDVIIMDQEIESLRALGERLDLQVVKGRASYPSDMAPLDPRSVNLFMATSDDDADNIIACQVAKHMFDIPITLAYLHHPDYINGLQSVYGAQTCPIDHIITPERTLAEAVVNGLSFPFSTVSLPLLPKEDGGAELLGIVVTGDSPFFRKQLSTLHKAVIEAGAAFVLLKRGDQCFYEGDRLAIQERDEVFMVADDDAKRQIQEAFGLGQPSTQHIVILGGGSIGFQVAQRIEETLPTKKVSVCIVEKNKERASMIAGALKQAVVINGSALDSDMLQEAEVGRADRVLSLMDDDENNILGALLAKTMEAKFVAVLVSNALYPRILPSLGVDMAITPQQVTVTDALKCLPLGPINVIHSFSGTPLLFCTIKVHLGSTCVHRAAKDFEVPAHTTVVGLLRESAVHPIEEDLKILPGDILLVVTSRVDVDRLKKMF